MRSFLAATTLLLASAQAQAGCVTAGVSVRCAEPFGNSYLTPGLQQPLSPPAIDPRIQLPAQTLGNARQRSLPPPALKTIPSCPNGGFRRSGAASCSDLPCRAPLRGGRRQPLSDC